MMVRAGVLEVLMGVDDVRNEMLYDFGVNMPRVLAAGKTVILDHIKQVALITESQIVVNNGAKYTAVSGTGIIIKQLEDERMLISGEIEKIEFYSGK